MAVWSSSLSCNGYRVVGLKLKTDICVADGHHDRHNLNVEMLRY